MFMCRWFCADDPEVKGAACVADTDSLDCLHDGLRSLCGSSLQFSAYDSGGVPLVIGSWLPLDSALGFCSAEEVRILSSRWLAEHGNTSPTMAQVADLLAEIRADEQPTCAAAEKADEE